MMVVYITGFNVHALVYGDFYDFHPLFHTFLPTFVNCEFLRFNF
jgi:hypothetical protein